MAAGSLALACAWLLLGQTPSDIFYTNQRNHRIDVNFKDAVRGAIREVRLFASVDPERKNWQQVGSITPEKDHFVFHAPADGYYWFRVAVVNAQGKQEPENVAVGPPDQKMVIDTQKPVIRVLQARRQGAQVAVNWEIQEDNPDPASFRMEYQAKEGSSNLWTAIGATAGPLGQAHFTPGGGQALVVRLLMRDLAGNLSYAIAEVPAEVTTAVFNGPPGTPSGGAQTIATTVPQPGPPDLGKQIPVPTPPPSPVPPPVAPPPVMPPAAGTASQMLPPLAPDSVKPVVGNPPPAPVIPPRVATNVLAPPTPPPLATPVQPPKPAVAMPAQPDLRVVASSKWTPAVAPKVPAPPPASPVPEPVAAPKPTIAKAPVRQLPELQYINQPEFMVEYEVSKIGPSGVGLVELYRTQDDGQTWELYAKDPEPASATPAVRHQRLVKIQEGEPDGVYGFILVIKNKAGIGRNPPVRGDAPELRIELDTTPPEADLYQPTPDVQQGRLLLRWKAADKNLTQAPISLEWSTGRNGPWNPIGIDIPNVGRFSWKLPEQLPVEVFLRLRVRDLAGNETVAITPNALPVDLHEPEGHLLKVSLPGR